MAASPQSSTVREAEGDWDCGLGGMGGFGLARERGARGNDGRRRVRGRRFARSRWLGGGWGWCGAAAPLDVGRQRPLAYVPVRGQYELARGRAARCVCSAFQAAKVWAPRFVLPIKYLLPTA